MVSLWGDVEHHWRDSATALATVYFLLQGTPFIYQGQEIGMTNTVFDGIADFDDVLARNRWQERVAAGEHPADVLADLSITARDNARTPMQWSAAPGAGFTTGEPWLKPNPNHARINVAAQEADPDSVLNYYRRLIALRKAERVLGRSGTLLRVGDAYGGFATWCSRKERERVDAWITRVKQLPGVRLAPVWLDGRPRPTAARGEGGPRPLRELPAGGHAGGTGARRRSRGAT